MLCFEQGERGSHGFKPILHLRPIGNDHRALAPTTTPITLLQAEKAIVIESS